jgi:dimethylaniline monooxygenase (N-oxide forming)
VFYKFGNGVTYLDKAVQVADQRRVAIVGSGPGGLVAAKYLSEHGFEPVIFEQADDIGGQWNVRCPGSGVWPSMVTNTSRLLTCFSDLRHRAESPLFLPNEEMLSYLHRYSERFGLVSRLRLRTRVELIERSVKDATWKITFRSQGSKPETAIFPYVVVASGLFNKPSIPRVPGLESFSGSGGVIHSFHYKEPASFRGKRVLVAGCAISALEVASDLAMLGAKRVVSTFRRQRYVIQKLVAGVPSDALAFTRFAALNGEVTPPEIIGKTTQEYVLRVFGSPEQFGAFKPAGDFATVGRGLSQHYLPLVAEGRIVTRPWIDKVEGQTVQFIDGSSEELDAIVFGTGFDLSLPFLSPEISRSLNLEALRIDLHKFTFHPDLPGLAFVGLFDQTGPYFPPLELQARWITYVWSGIRRAPSRDEMCAGIATYRSQRGGSQKPSMHTMSLLLAREAGVEPDLSQHPALARALLFGPLTSISFRLSGPDCLPDIAARIAAEARALRTVVSPEFSAEELTQLANLAAARKDSPFTDFVNRVRRYGLTLQ